MKRNPKPPADPPKEEGGVAKKRGGDHGNQHTGGKRQRAASGTLPRSRDEAARVLGVGRGEARATEQSPTPAPPSRFSSVLGFDRAARRLLCDDRESEQWSEAEQHAMAIVRALAVTLTGGPAHDALPWLRAAREALRGSDAARWRTYYCARAVTQHAGRWRACEPADRPLVLASLVHELSAHDDAFQALAAQHQLLASKLDAFHPAPGRQRGKKSPTRILAELIFEGELDALEATDRHRRAENPVRTIRKILERHVGRCRELIAEID